MSPSRQHGCEAAAPPSEEHRALTLALAAASPDDFTTRTPGQAGSDDGLHKSGQGGSDLSAARRKTPPPIARKRLSKGKRPRRRLPRGYTSFRLPAPAMARRWEGGGGRWRLIGLGRRSSRRRDDAGVSSTERLFQRN